MKKLLYIIPGIFISMNVFGQTTLIDPTVSTSPNGSFENATSTFAANGWTVVNAGTNQWQVGTFVFNPGAKGAYIGTGAGNNNYNNGTSQTSHFYRSINFPAGETAITLSFNWKCVGESGYDRLLVYTNTAAPAAGTPASNTTAWGTAVLVAGPYNSQSTWQTATVTLPAALAGTTRNLIFTWQNDNAFGTNPAIAIDNISLVSALPPPPPANNLCANATNLPCGTTNLAGTTVNCANVANGTGCTMGDYGVWYTFAGNNQSTTISSTAVFDHEMAIMSGSCGSLTNITCQDGAFSGGTESYTFFAATGTTYYVYIGHYNSGSTTTGTFTISRTCIAPPANDNCAGAIAATVNGDLLCGSVTPGTVVGASASGPAGCAGTADDDVWFSFSATSTVHNFDLLNVAGSVTNMVMEVFSGACGSLASIACSDPNSAQFSGFTIGQTYYLRVFTNTATGGQNTTFDVCIGTPPPPPSNDEPCGAIPLNVNIGSCSYQSAILGTSTTASAGIPVPGCSSLGPDIWFTATVPASGRLIIDMATSGGPTDMGMAWYTGPNCSTINTLVECDDDDSQNGAMPMICRTGVACNIPGDCAQNPTLAPGTVVYVRVWEYGGGTFGPFDICAYDPGPPGGVINCANAVVVPSLPFSDAGQTTCCRGNDYTSSDACGSIYENGEDYLYQFTPSANTVVDITLTGTLAYTGVFLTDKCPSAGGANCVASNTSATGNPKICGATLTAGTTYYIMVDTDPSPTCTPFNINISSGSSYTCNLNYTPSSIGFAPDLNAGTNIALPIDDRFYTSYIPIGFDFCFDGYQFNSLLVSSNGYLIFDPISCASNLPGANAAPGAYSAWPINTAVPNTTQAPRNCIMFPWQDIDPSIGGTIRYQVLGSSPNRRFVLTMDNIPYYNCTGLRFTGQVKLFETSNDIEVHLTNKTICGTWNGSNAILGLHNFNGTIASVPGGYNSPTNWTATNQAWKFTCNCVGCTPLLLPIDLMNFSATCKNNNAEISWSTASERNNDYFTLERSMDAVNFNEIAVIQGQSYSSTEKKYGYTDKEVFGGRWYYRLKQTDLNGEYTYSEITTFDCNESGGKVTYFPNPFVNELTIKVNDINDESAMVEMIDVLGNTVIVREISNIRPDSNQFSLDLSGIASGIYTVRFQSGTFSYVSKILKK